MIVQSLGSLGSTVGDDLARLEVVDPGQPLMDAGSMDGRGIYDAQPSVRKVVDFIARNVASTAFHLYSRDEEDGRERVRDSELAQLLAQPSDKMTPYRFWVSLITDWLLNDRYAAMKVRNALGQTRLHRIPPRRFKIMADSLDQPRAIRVWSEDGKWTDMDLSRFVWDSGYSDRGSNGTSPMRTLRNLIEESNEAVSWRRAIWKNGARVPGVLEKEGEWSSPEARTRFIEGFREFRRNGAEAGGMPLLEDNVKLKESGIYKPRDTEDLEGRRLTDIEVSSAYHVAPELVGARVANYSSMDVFRQMLWGPSLGPYIEAFQQALGFSLLPDLGEPGEYVEANLEGKMRGSFLEQAAVMQSATGAPWMLRSEARSKQNMPAIDGADELVVPLNVLIGGQASPRDGQTEGGGGGTLPPADPDDPEPAKSYRGPQVKNRAPQTYVTKSEQALRAFYKRQGAAVLSALGADDESWWDGERWDKELTDTLHALAEIITEKVGMDTVMALGTDEEYDLVRTQAFIRAVAVSRAAMINQATLDAVTAALEAPEDPEVPEPVKDVFTDAEQVRAAAGAASLVTTFSAFATAEAAKQLSGNKGTKQWVVTSKNPRPEHAAMDGQTVGIEEKFSNGADWPGDPVLGADGVSGCECTVVVTVG